MRKIPKKSLLWYLHRFYFNGQLFSAPLLFLAWLFLILLDSLIYPNYVFTKIHIIPANLAFPVFFSIFILIIGFVREIIERKRGSNLKNAVKFLPIFIFFILIINQNTKTLTFIASESRYILKDPTASYEKKMEYKWGSDFISFITLIKTITPPTAVILIPPRSEPWPLEGNDHLMRGLLYPRKIISYDKKQDLTKEKIDYMLLTWGFWRGITDKKDTTHFPTFPVKAKSIYLFDTKEKTAKKLDAAHYSPQDQRYYYKFGLLEL